MKIQNAISNTEFSFIILAGGKSSRMGRDKCYLEYRGKTFLEIQVENGKALGIQDIIVSGSHQVNGNIRVVKDRFMERGPLGGLEACLRSAKNKRCVVVCADNPLLTKELLQKLIDLSRDIEGPVVACEHNGKQESLIGIFDTSVADEMQEELMNRKGSVFAFLNRIGCKWVNLDEFESCFYNINRPEEYEKIVERENYNGNIMAECVGGER